jgi:alpha-galactosidase
LRKHLDRYLKVRPIYTGDYYPLTPHTLEKNQWIAWQFHRADLGESVVQAFRGLDPNQRYEIANLDGGKDVCTGEELMAGHSITLPGKPAAAVLVLTALR